MCRFTSIKLDQCWPEQWHSSQLVWVYSKAISPLYLWESRFFLERQLQDASTWLSGKKSTCQCKRHRRHEFEPWVRKIPWRGKWQPATLFFAWRIPRTEEPGGLQSTGSQKATHNWACPHAAAITISEGQTKRLRPCPLVYRHTHFKSYNCISCQDVTKIKKK